jgi:hypothetical protein
MGMGMLFRTAPPLALALYWHETQPELAKAGIVYDVLVFYLVILVVETLLTVRQLNTPAAKRDASQDAISGRMGAIHG